VVLALLGQASSMPASPPPRVDSIADRIDRIVVPSIQAKEAPFRDLVDFIKQKIRDWEPGREASESGFSVIVDLDEGGPLPFEYFTRPITYHRKNVPLPQLFADLAELGGVWIWVTDTAVVITPPGRPAFPNSKATTGRVDRVYKPKAKPAK
jgi:hypothetical protein